MHNKAQLATSLPEATQLVYSQNNCMLIFTPHHHGGKKSLECENSELKVDL